MKKTIAIIGATSAIAMHCARLWAQQGSVHFLLIARNLDKLERVSADLLIRNPQCSVEIVVTDLLDGVSIQQTVTGLSNKNRMDIVLIAHGALTLQNDCQLDLETCQTTLEVNGVSPVLWAEMFAQELVKNNHGTVAIIGSVAGDRGRKSNYAYGAAKSMVACYTQGMQHRFAGTGVSIVLIKPGPIDTPMTASYKARGIPLASVEKTAKQIVSAIEKRQLVSYVPKKWRGIMFIVKRIPQRVFNLLEI